MGLGVLILERAIDVSPIAMAEMRKVVHGCVRNVLRDRDCHTLKALANGRFDVISGQKALAKVDWR